MPPKQAVTMRLDADVLEWFRQQGKGYQTRINRLLRAYMQTQQRRHS
ncbi:BrnA antitoxin family protein [Caballeronia pedi]|nr:BrnA antitoxin family protein [Caballeronia pedi]